MDQLLNTKEAAKFLSISQAYLVKLRLTGNGPEFIKLGRSVRYSICSLEAWIQENIKQSTTEASEPRTPLKELSI